MPPSCRFTWRKRAALAVPPSAPPNHPRSPRGSRRRRRTRSTKTSRVSGVGSTDSRTVLQSAGELACRAFASANVPLSFSFSHHRPPFVHPVHIRDANTRITSHRRGDVVPFLRSVAIANQEFRGMKPRDGPSWGGSWIESEYSRDKNVPRAMRMFDEDSHARNDTTRRLVGWIVFKVGFSRKWLCSAWCSACRMILESTFKNPIYRHSRLSIDIERKSFFARLR